MSNPNDLLRDLRTDMGLEVCPEVPTEIWRRLDAACKAGNLPDEWLPLHEAATYKKRMLELEAEVALLNARLGKKVGELSIALVERDEAVALLKRMWEDGVIRCSSSYPAKVESFLSKITPSKEAGDE